MRATILPYAIILTKAHRAAVSIIAKGCMWSEVLGASTIYQVLVGVFYYLH